MPGIISGWTSERKEMAEYVDADDANYQALSTVDADLDERLRDRYVKLFLAQSGLSWQRYDQAFEMLSLARGVLPNGELLLRIEFPFMGSTTWRGWDGSEPGALQSVEEEAHLKAREVGLDQAEGPTGWEP